MIRISNIKLGIDSGEGRLLAKAAAMLGVKPSEIKSYEIVKKSLDARNKNNICFVYTIDALVTGEERFLGRKGVSKAVKAAYIPPRPKQAGSSLKGSRPVIIGAGPAGLFAALILSEAGLSPIIIERGKPVEQRRADVELFWQTGKLHGHSNVQFGEGGAGAFSDGKLTTGIKDFRMGKVLDTFVSCGAPEEIQYLAKPHIGTDRLFHVLISLREKITSLGGEYRFNHIFTGFRTEGGALKSVLVRQAETGAEEELSCSGCIMAIGHSARDTFEMLDSKGICLEAKAFSAGVRIEHKQSSINAAQYGRFHSHKALGAADYKLSCKAGGRGVYTFCMCPGGQVVAAASEKGRLVTNGMSYYSRNLENANSALLVSVSPGDFPGTSPLRGIDFQRKLEEQAFILGGGNYRAPVQLAGDFLAGRATKEIGGVRPSYQPGYTPVDLRECLPPMITNPLKEALHIMGRQVDGFDVYDAVLTAVESRSSSPVRIVRDQSFHSSVRGLLPCGEGAGYAGGIMSACVDGIKCAEKLLNS